jgi:hypothetical protein
VKKILNFILILAGFTACASAQQTQDLIGNFTFSYFVNGVPPPSPVTPNGFINLGDVNVGQTATVTLLTSSTTQTLQPYKLTNATISTISGEGFSLPSTETAVPIGGTGTLRINFTPTNTNPQKTTERLDFQLISATNTIFNVSITLFANVLQPKLILSYIDPVDGNQIPLSQGGTLQFPKTMVKSTSSARIVVVNTGTGNGTVDSVSIRGDGFVLTNEPLTPAVVNAGSSFTVGVTFMPTAILEYKGTATISIGGVSTTINLDGQGTNSMLTYSLLGIVGSGALQPNGVIAFPDTPADGVSKSAITVQVQNTGNQAGQLSSILAFGSDFQVTNLPVLPQILNPGDIVVFNVVFMPAKTGTSTGRLQIGSDVFNLTGNALGSALSLAVDVGLGPTAVANKSVISLPSTTVGDKRLIYITVTNTGNQTAIVNGIGVSGSGFSIPTLTGPATISPSQTIQYQVQFAPVNTNSVIGTVNINDMTLTLIGSGQLPPPLPALLFTNVSSVLAPLQQPAAGLQLSAPYPFDVKGVLTLSFIPDSFVDDPSIQFAIGGRTINFFIPANTTQATFLQPSSAALGALAAFQTGTVSGTISLTASGLTVGQVDVTPTLAPSRSFQIPATVPQLRSIRVQSSAGNQLVLLISGYSPPRNLSQLSFQFTGTSGSDLTTTGLNLDVSGAFTNWYDSNASRVFGSQFSVSVTATITGDPAALQSISVTATNSKGTSAPQTVALR